MIELLCFQTTLYSHYSLSSSYTSEVLFAVEQIATEILNVKILIRVRPLGISLTFSSPLGLLKFQDFPSFLFILKLSYSKPFHST